MLVQYIPQLSYQSWGRLLGWVGGLGESFVHIAFICIDVFHPRINGMILQTKLEFSETTDFLLNQDQDLF